MTQKVGKDVWTKGTLTSLEWGLKQTVERLTHVKSAEIRKTQAKFLWKGWYLL